MSGTKVKKPVFKDETARQLVEAVIGVRDAITGGGSTIYGFHVNGAEADPYASVSYIKDAVGMTPAAMNYATGKFDYGSWERAFFMPRPCMLKSNGYVDYYLDPNDYSKKLDGSVSDIANTSYDGNAMMEWGRDGKKIWMKIVPDADPKSGSVYIADYQVDSTYHDWPFHNCKGAATEHFYTPIYNGSVISSKMRSLSGQQVSKTLSATEEMTAAKLNNPGSDELWNIECWADRMLINALLVLMGKSLNTQKIFGEGAHTGGSEAINDTFRTGVHNTKGLFFGTNSGSVASESFGNCVKVFGMENYWGFQWRRHNGLISANGDVRTKLTYGTEDGSTATGYNTDGSGYKSTGVTPSGTTNGGWIAEGKFTDDGIFPSVTGGSASSSTYYCDYLYFNNNATTFALLGGASDSGSSVGAFCSALHAASSVRAWTYGAAVSCKPLA